MLTKAEYLRKIVHDSLSVPSGTRYDYSEVPARVAITSRITVRCPDHGPWSPLAFSHCRHKCAKCATIGMRQKKLGVASATKQTFSAVLQRVQERWPQLDVSSNDTPSNRAHWNKVNVPKRKWAVRCRLHTTSFTRTLNYLLYEKSSGCPDCVSAQADERNSKLRFEEGRDNCAASAQALGYTLEHYTKATEPATFRCQTHGSFSVAAAYYMTQYMASCPACRKGRSTPELLAQKRFHELGLRVDVNRRDLLGRGLEVDIYLPQLHVGLEINGTRFHGIAEWHLDRPAGVPKLAYKRHLVKASAAAERKLPLVQVDGGIFARHQGDLLVSMVLAKAGVFAYRLYARDTTLRVLPASLASRFLQHNHLQGAIPASSYLGLEHKGRLVAVACFGRPRFSKAHSFELLRFATERYYQVTGGLSKLIAGFVAATGACGSLISYADKMHSQGKVYHSVGFSHLRTTAPSYTYVGKRQVLSRFQAQKKRLPSLLGADFDPTLSERDNMLRAGYIQLFDAGTEVFELTLPSVRHNPQLTSGLISWAPLPTVPPAHISSATRYSLKKQLKGLEAA